MTSAVHKLSKFVVLILLMAPSVAYGWGRANGIPDFPSNSDYPVEWFACEKDEDCLKTYDCADITINRDYFEQFKKMQHGCDAAIIPNPKVIARCIHNKCSLIDPGPAQ